MGRLLDMIADTCRVQSDNHRLPVDDPQVRSVVKTKETVRNNLLIGHTIAIMFI